MDDQLALEKRANGYVPRDADGNYLRGSYRYNATAGKRLEARIDMVVRMAKGRDFSGEDVLHDRQDIFRSGRVRAKRVG